MLQRHRECKKRNVRQSLSFRPPSFRLCRVLRHGPGDKLAPHSCHSRSTSAAHSFNTQRSVGKWGSYQIYTSNNQAALRCKERHFREFRRLRRSSSNKTIPKWLFYNVHTTTCHVCYTLDGYCRILGQCKSDRQTGKGLREGRKYL